MSRLTDDTKVINEFISQKLPNLLPSIVTLVGSLIMLFILDWKMTLLTFITIPIFVLIMIPLDVLCKRYRQVHNLKLQTLVVCWACPN